MAHRLVDVEQGRCGDCGETGLFGVDQDTVCRGRRVPSAQMTRELEDALRYAEGVREALDQIYELREAGERVPAADFKRLERLIEDLATHEAFADVEGFRKGYRL